MAMFNVGSTVKRIIQEFRALRCDDEGVLHVMTPTGYHVDANIQDQVTDPVNLYLHRVEATPSLSGTQTLDSYTVTLDSTTNIDVGDAITIKESGKSFQSIVDSISAGVSVNIKSPLDYAFTTSASVKIGSWNLNVNGSVTPVEFEIGPIPDVDIDIYTLTINIIDGDTMDSSKFGSITTLDMGLVVRHENSSVKNLALLNNNSGFSEQGFTTIYDPAPPAGEYGVRHTLHFPTAFGVARRILDAPGERMVLIVQDNLTALDKVVGTVGGHIVLD